MGGCSFSRGRLPFTHDPFQCSLLFSPVFRPWEKLNEKLQDQYFESLLC